VLKPGPGDATAAMARSDESRLVARARKGHADSFRALVDAYKDRLFAFVFRMVRNYHEAEDICQATFVRAYESLASYNEAWAFSTWLFTIAYRLGLNQMRRRKAVGNDTNFALMDAGDEAAPESVANSEAARLLKSVIWNAVAGLSPAQKSAVLLFYRESKSCQEIGEVLGVPAVTVKSHLHRAREKLRKVLSGQLVDDWAALDFLSETGSA
jgi:RNA polymerase sigma-70 factor (ECF subfamily)